MSRRRQGLELDDRILALRRAVELAQGRLPAEDVAAAQAVSLHVDARLGHGLEHTVVALAGATGSGKSSLFNALARVDLSAVAARRPTTAETHACVWGEADAGPLLDWLGVSRRHLGGSADPSADGLVLLDLPDFDSTAAEHRLVVDRLVAVVDLLVWVLDPQKYADAVLHERYLRPLAGHAGVMLFALNQADLLDDRATAACLSDLRHLLDEDGVEGAPIVAVSARTGDGLDGLRDSIVERVTARRAAVERLTADVVTAAGRLARPCADLPRGGQVGRGERARLVDALATAAGVDLVTDAVGREHRQAAAGATGWPLTRWVRKVRPNPLRRLHLQASGGSAARTSIPPASAASRAMVSRAVRAAADAAAGELPAPWPALVRDAAVRSEDALPDDLDRAVARTDLGAARRPRWWAAAAWLQRALAAAMVVGAVWLLVLAGFGYLKLPEPPTPDVGRFPLPTLLLLGGLAAGLLLAGIARLVARSASRRRAAAARRRLLVEIESVAEDRVLAPLRQELDDIAELCASLEAAAGR